MDPISSGTPLAPSTASSSQASGGAAALSSDFETFLTMLTVQMQNQDPLNPVEASDFAVQLATFSSVEQQVRTNELLESLAANLGGNPLQEMGSWVGMEALVTGPARFEGTPISVTYEAPEDVQTLHLVVRDQDDAVVHRQELDPEATRTEWDGTGLDGAVQSHGNYRLSIEARLVGTSEPEPELPVQVYVAIDEIRLDGSDALLRLANSQEILSTRISGLRTPSR